MKTPPMELPALIFVLHFFFFNYIFNKNILRDFFEKIIFLNRKTFLLILFFIKQLITNIKYYT